MFVGWRKAMSSAVALAVLFLASAPASAQQTPVGVIDPDSLELEDLSPGFLGLYRKVMEIEERIRTHSSRYGLDYDLARAVSSDPDNCRVTLLLGKETKPIGVMAMAGDGFGVLMPVSLDHDGKVEALANQYDRLSAEYCGRGGDA